MARSRATLVNMTLSPAGQAEVRLREGGRRELQSWGACMLVWGSHTYSKFPSCQSSQKSEGPKRRILEDMTGKKGESRP